LVLVVLPFLTERVVPDLAELALAGLALAGLVLAGLVLRA
jgi:hypothetical protein